MGKVMGVGEDAMRTIPEQGFGQWARRVGTFCAIAASVHSIDGAAQSATQVAPPAAAPAAAQQSAPAAPVAAQTAQAAAQAPAPTGWFSQATMTGDWGGARTSLKDFGITTRGFYWDEFAANPIGGRRQGHSNAQQLGLAADFDMGKLAGWSGGTFHIALSNRWGASDSAKYVGNALEDQSDFGAGQNIRLAQLSYEQLLADGKVDLQFGFMADFGYSFGFSFLLCDFQNVGFCAHPFILYRDSGATAYPTAQWGAMVKYNIASNQYVETGAFEVNPSRLDHQNGFNMSLHGTTGKLYPLEYGVTTALGSDQLPGHYKFGGYYDSSSVNDAAYADLRRTGRYGVYALVDQMLFRLQPDTDRGLIAFAQGTRSDKRTSPLPFSLNAGLILQGPFASRPADYLAFGVVYEPLNRRVYNAQRDRLFQQEALDPSLYHGETDMELGYGLSLAPWLMINPNVQYMIHPGAFTYTQGKNALVVGVQAKVLF